VVLDFYRGGGVLDTTTVGGVLAPCILKADPLLSYSKINVFAWKNILTILRGAAPKNFSTPSFYFN
jgi:hypothetical protein